MKEKFVWNVPNVLSLYRIGIAPVIAWFVYAADYRLFTLFFVISLITDILDGFIARRFNLQTAVGARLDSLGDIINVILGVVGMFRFQYSSVREYIVWFIVIAGLYLLVLFVSFARFRKYSSLHLYSSKITGYLQGGFFVVLFCAGFYAAVFWIMFAVSCLSYVEEIAVLLMMKEEKSNAKGLYWIWREK